MRRRSPILEKLAELYAASTPGLTGAASRDFSIRFERLLNAANCASGDAYDNAIADLLAHDGKTLKLQKHRRSHDIQRIKVPLAMEHALFAAIGRMAPTDERRGWSALFFEAASWAVPAEFTETWKDFCVRRADRVLRGEGWLPFRRQRRHRAHLQLETVARLLSWHHPALLRTVSAQVCGNSKFLETCVGTIEQLLDEASAGRIRSLVDLQISDNPRSVRFHGPIRVRLHGDWHDFRRQSDAILSESDLAAAEVIECNAPRCVTVENATKFHELCALKCSDLFVFTSYPNQATVEFLKRLPTSLPRFHFGDTDPWGFDVLRSLRTLLGPTIPVQPLHMYFRPKEGSPVLSDRDRRKLQCLLEDPSLEDVRDELQKIEAAGTKGDFEQETILVSSPFPYAVTR